MPYSPSHTNNPSFIIIGAMKSATTTLYEQLISLPGIYMPELKEPNFFSDDNQYERGKEWYQALFAESSVGDILGEASTHYTKLPDYPDTLPRMTEMLPELKLIYVMRHPIERLVSHYVHEWSQGTISLDINQAIKNYPRLIDYSRYSYQLTPFFEAYGRNSVLPVFFENIKTSPQLVLNEVCQFIGYEKSSEWNNTIAPSNVSQDRIRKFPLYDLVIDSSVAQLIRRNIIPKSIRDKVKGLFQMRQRPELNEDSLLFLQKTFDDDLAVLGEWLGVDINCENYKTVVMNTDLNWKL